MLLDPNDLTELFGNGGQKYEDFLFDLVTFQCGKVGIPPEAISWDERVNQGDGGRDIIVDATHDSDHCLVSKNKTIVSAKSGDDGKNASKYKGEIRNHPHVIAHLKQGGTYLLICPRSLSQDDRAAMSKAATDIAEELEFDVELLEFRWPDSITSYANEHLGLIAKHFPFANRRLKKLITLNELLQDGGFGFDVPWVESEGRNNILDRVTKHLLESGEGSNVLHIAGLSGTGKTRLVHHACSTNDELTGTFYAGSFSEFESNRDFLRFLDQSEVSGHLIIDEVPLSKLDSLRGLLRYCVNRVRVVSIGPAPRSQTHNPQDEKILVLNESENELTLDGIIRNSYGGIGDPVRKSIVRASNHDLRLGIMLAQATVKNPEFINEPIGGLQDVWDRVTSLFQDQLGDQFADHFQPMTIAFDVGIADDYRQEIEFLSGWFERNIGAMDQAVSKAHECGLGLKTKCFFEPQPGALARWVFEENIWPMVENRLEELLDAMPIRLNKKFIERCQECIGPKREEIAHRVSGFFLSRLNQYGLGAVSNSKVSRLFKAWAELDPENGLKWLREQVESAPEGELENLDGGTDGFGDWGGRRHIVWLCENLACFEQSYRDCERILFSLALAETETNISNNSTAAWKGMFLPMLSNTETDFGERIEILRGRVAGSTKSEFNLVIDAVLGIFSRSSPRIAPPSIVGGRIVPKQFAPKTYEELHQLKSEAANSLLGAILSAGPQKIEAARAVISKSLFNIGQFADVELLISLFPTEELNDITRIQLLNSVDSCVDYLDSLDRSDIGDQILERYQEWKKTLQPASLIERIKYQTSQDQWGSRSGLSIKESNQKLNEQFMELAKESIVTAEISVGLKDWVGNSLDKNSRMLAFHLGQFDEQGVFEEEFLSWVDDPKKLDFVLTYLNCRSHHFPDSRVEMQRHLDSLSRDNPQVSVQATIKADVSEVGFERIASVLPKLESLKQLPLLDLGFGAWDELLEPKKKAELLTAIIRHPSPDGFPTALKLAAFILESENEEESQSKEFRDVIEEVLVASMETEARFEVHDLIDPVEFIADSNVQLAAEVVCQQVFGTLSNIIASNALSQSFNWLVVRDQTTAFQAVGPHLLAEDARQRFGISVYREFFDKFDKETVEVWIQQTQSDSEEIAKLLARHVASPRIHDNEVQLSGFTDWILNDFADNDDVFSSYLMGRHSFEVNPVFEYSDLRSVEDNYGRYQDYPSRRVREWAEWEIKQAASEAEWNEHHTDEMNRR